MSSWIQKYDPPAAGTPADQEVATQAYIQYVGVVPTQATKLYE
jgi:hypothetical protein